MAIDLYRARCATDFRSGVVLSANHGRDSDSTGAITGNLLRAMKGIEAIPMRWLAPLEVRGLIEAMRPILQSSADTVR
ncbi:ADP-ribosylglycohydrolase family protein [Burkholderia arboris]|uniref:ADP-ribosylglycohydrolase family protein n=1 Tax=Burkholderia arboris TaxID=488730 RepID=UPI001CF12D4E|nr:ADP-ribosylglycohydrolase family protein [Burkholderia arboris]